ncbi:DUF6518 family protein [Actinomadura gamaensis]|uniref:DUF6518 family protein n=1 Tax=Actinomadura gamaensis TaxID=1763541 RepID=A0ABV9TU54_9ACTN
MLACDPATEGDDRARSARRRTAPAFLAAALVGMAAGVFTFGMKRLDDAPPWLGFWHGVAPWGVAAALAGAAFAGRWRAAAVAGAITQLGLVAGYYTIESVALGTVSTDLSVHTAVGLVAGALYGASGALVRGPRHGARVPASGFLAAPWLADGSRTLLDDVTDSGSGLAVAVGVLLFGAVLPFALNHSPRTRVAGFALAIALAVLILWTKHVPLG